MPVKNHIFDKQPKKHQIVIQPVLNVALSAKILVITKKRCLGYFLLKGQIAHEE
jgi:hypothetical protein